MRAPLSFLLLAACGTASGTEGDAGGQAVDAGPRPCAEQRPLIIGHCVDDATGNPCVNFDSEERRFVALSSSDTVQPIIGFQGAPMFVMAVRGQGILPGEDEAALVSVRIRNGDQEIGGYQARPLLIPGDAAGEMIAPQLYVIVFLAEEAPGAVLDIRAEVADDAGGQWCAESSFVMGEIIEPSE